MSWWLMGVEHLMPGYKGQRLVSETIVRPKNSARVVITLEVSLDSDAMKSIPAYKRTAIRFLRDLASENKTPQGMLAALEEIEGIYVTDTKTEIGG